MSQANTALLSTTYLGPVQYFTKFLRYDTLYLEVEENYQKQSYRNRCIILSANGVMPLTIPVTKDRPKERTRDICIDNTLEWQKNHWTSIESAYSSSPFFEFLADDFAPFYRKRYRFLLDFTMPMLEMVLGHLEIHPSVKLTQRYQKEPEPAVDDLRAMIHPKKRAQKPDPAFEPAFYYQVFQARYGFVPNLSIIDLLFNEGANAENVLKKSIAGMT